MCDQGEVGRGLLWLARSLELATEADPSSLDRPVRINLADWASQLSRTRRLPAMRHSGAVVGVAFRRQGRVLVSVGKDGAARIWDTKSGKQVGAHRSCTPVLRKRRSNEPSSLPASGLLRTVDHKGRTIVWNIDQRLSLSPSGASFRRHRTSESELPELQSLPVSTAWALSSDSRMLVTGGEDGRVVRWDVSTRRPIGPDLDLDTPVEAVALTPDGRKLITGGRAGRLHVWDAETKRGFDLPPQGAEVSSLAVSPDGRVYASGTESGVIRLWDTSLLGPIGQTIKLAGAVTALAFDPDGRVLAIGSDDGTIRLREIPYSKAVGFPLQFNDAVQTLTFQEDGRRLLIGTAAGARALELTGSTVEQSNQHRVDFLSDGATSEVEATAVSPDGRILATARTEADEQRVRGWVEFQDAMTGKSVRQTPPQSHRVCGLVFSPDSKWLLTWGPESRESGLWDVAHLQAPRPMFWSLESPIRQAAFSRDGRTVLLGCRDGKARLWNLKKDAIIGFEPGPQHAYPITAVAFDPESSRVVTGCHAGTVRVWDLARGMLLNELRQNAGEIVVLSFSPDGKTLVTASRDGTARFVDAQSGAQLGPALHHTDAVLSVAFDPDGQSVMTGTRDGMVQRWSVPSAPWNGRVAELRPWLKEQTGMELDDRGAVMMDSACE